MESKYKAEVLDPFKELIGNGKEGICVTTNGIVMQNGKAVMGAGIAKFVRDSFPDVDSKLGDFISKYGNRVFNLGTHEFEGKQFRLISFPTKNDWKDKSDLNLIEKSANELVSISDKFDLDKIYLPEVQKKTGMIFQEFNLVKKIIYNIAETCH